MLGDLALLGDLTAKLHQSREVVGVELATVGLVSWRRARWFGIRAPRASRICKTRCSPAYRACAHSESRFNADDADDLVQETIVRGWSTLHRFERGTNLRAWLFTILRNLFYSRYRKRRHEVEDPDEKHAARLTIDPDQLARVAHVELLRALAFLSAEHREAVLLVGAEGMSYGEAAEICRVPVGTMKSRVHRARTQLAVLMHSDDADRVGATKMVA